MSLRNRDEKNLIDITGDPEDEHAEDHLIFEDLAELARENCPEGKCQMLLNLNYGMLTVLIGSKYVRMRPNYEPPLHIDDELQQIVNISDKFWNENLERIPDHKAAMISIDETLKLKK